MYIFQGGSCFGWEISHPGGGEKSPTQPASQATSASYREQDVTDVNGVPAKVRRP